MDIQKQNVPSEEKFVLTILKLIQGKKFPRTEAVSQPEIFKRNLYLEVSKFQGR